MPELSANTPIGTSSTATPAEIVEAAAGAVITQGTGVADAAAVTTVGANTGTAAAGLSLIGDTSTVDQSGALMNDFASIQEDLVELRTQLNALITSLEGSGVIATV